MDEKITLTGEMMERARDYVPLAEKEAWVAENAPKCFDKLQITSDDEPMPPMYMVNTGLKSRYLMGALVKLYFGAESKTEQDDEWLPTVEQYDAWAGIHIMNQLERMKRDSAYKSKAYDLTFDYKDLEKRFSTQISSLLSVQNDPVIRQAQQMAGSAKELLAMLEQLKELEKKKDGADSR